MKEIGRREFIRTGTWAGLGLGLGLGALGSAAAESVPNEPQVRRYSRLGRTDMQISDISFGADRLSTGQEDLVQHAYDRGINYFDTAETYGDSESALGHALRGKRHRVFIASKTLAWPDTSMQAMMQALEGSLRRLQTDYVDVYFNHAVNDLERLKNPEWYAFVEAAKRQGKIRFSGVSGHAGHLGECLDYAIDSGNCDVILCAYNFGQDPLFYQRFLGGFDMVARQPDLPRILKKAKHREIGVIVM